MKNTQEHTEPMRINKYLAMHGYASRRTADTLIEKGYVFINDKPATIGQKVDAGDVVRVLKDTKALAYQYILYYKPRGQQVHSDTSVSDNVLNHLAHDHSITGVFPIGRLDKDIEGLLVMTDDGRITQPLQKAPQTYEVRVDARVTQTFLRKLASGVRIQNFQSAPAQVTASPSDEKAFTITYTGTRQYHIKRICAALGYHVESLKRTAIDTLELRTLKPGQFHRLSHKEISYLTKRYKLKN